MKPRMTDAQLRRFYKLLSVSMIDFDCGKLCAPKNNGIPACCENVNCVPILFREEFKWHQKNGMFWKRMPPVTKEIKKFIDESEDYYVFSKCPGPEGCKRNKRSLNCMTYPFQPSVNKKGEVIGLSHVDEENGHCPLTRKPKNVFNPLYISNSIMFWQELFVFYPEEQKLYISETKKRENRAKRKGRKLRIFNSKGTEGH